MSDPYQQAQDAMMEHSDELAFAQSTVTIWRQCAEARGARIEVAEITMADMRRTISDLVAKAHPLARELAAAQATIADLRVALALQHQRQRIANNAALATIADLRAMLAAQQAVIAATPAVSDAIADALLYGHSAVRVTHVDMSDSPKHIVAVADSRSCTCHPSEAPVPCQRKYALSECKAAASTFPSRALRGGDGIVR